VAQGVVDVLETVEIDVQQRRESAVDARVLDGLGQPFGEQCAVGQVGEHVVQRQPFEFVDNSRAAVTS